MRIARAIPVANQVLLWAAIAAFILFARSLAAGQDITRYEVFGGYSFLRFDGPKIGFANYPNMNGWKLDGAFNIGNRFSVVADVGGDYGSKLSTYTFMAGGRYSWRQERSRYFGQFLFGKAQDNVSIPQPTRNGFESVGWSLAGGGGYERNLTSRLTFRVIEAEYLRTHTFSNSQNDFRVSTGIVVHLGSIRKRPSL